MAAAEAISLEAEPFTVWWNARGVPIEVEHKIALRSDTYRTYEASSFSRKNKFFLNWSAADVHELLDLLRDSPELIRVDLSAKPPTLAAYLMIDVANCQKREDNDVKDEKQKCVSLLLKIASKIKTNPDKFLCFGTSSSSESHYNCGPLIPLTYSVTTLARYLPDVPSISTDGDKYKWSWDNVPASYLFIKRVTVEKIEIFY
ncbi:MAG: hypothetical protein Hyperionvirus1_166 [Hyperionvirus sp.]|uniref:Uncharacterized protein n=1 Tax=Hyperionvirus sp. TaxID=2487770 RepID=A0A3G5A5T0_9VIRU|nr:MAG: hypothetical protein Hyperionvirus1_166 [Hyperionvirus sp.]